MRIEAYELMLFCDLCAIRPLAAPRALAVFDGLDESDARRVAGASGWVAGARGSVEADLCPLHASVPTDAVALLREHPARRI